MASLLIIKLSALGDVVQADGAIRDIREHHPHDHITVMTTPPYRRFMEKCPWVDDVIIDPRASRFNVAALLRLRRRLRKMEVDRVYDLQQVGRTRFYFRWVFPKVEWCGDAPGCTFYLRRNVATTCAPEHFASHLGLAGVTVRHTLQTDVSWMAAPVDHILADAGLSPGYIVLFPGASAAHQIKRWPYFQELAGRLQEYGKQVVTIPGPDEIDLCRSIPGTMLAPEGGFYDFFVLAGIVQHAAYGVGNDTGPTHIAANMGCPGLALYSGHASPETTGIQYTSFAWLESENLENLSVDTVLEHVVANMSAPGWL